MRKCEADALTLAPIGAARTLAQIRRAPVAVGISLARMARIVAYEPDDMTVVAEAGITLGELNAPDGAAPAIARRSMRPRDDDARLVIGAQRPAPSGFPRASCATCSSELVSSDTKGGSFTAAAAWSKTSPATIL